MGRGLQKPEQSEDDRLLRLKILSMAVPAAGSDPIAVAQAMYDWVKNEPKKSEGE